MFVGAALRRRPSGHNNPEMLLPSQAERGGHGVPPLQYASIRFLLFKVGLIFYDGGRLLGEFGLFVRIQAGKDVKSFTSSD